jgi:hypothetical protein
MGREIVKWWRKKEVGRKEKMAEEEEEEKWKWERRTV